jgi:hypothetical protein
MYQLVESSDVVFTEFLNERAGCAAVNDEQKQWWEESPSEHIPSEESVPQELVEAIFDTIKRLMNDR